MGTSLTVSQMTFTREVLEASRQKPILVDFYATWCGPCQLLKPVLENLVQEYDFILAKVDIDQNPDLAKQYGVNGVPDVRIVIDGQVQPGFVGMLPEAAIRELLHRLQLTSVLDQALEGIYGKASTGDIVGAEADLQTLLEKNPKNAGLVLEAANFYMEADQVEQAEAMLGRIPQHEKELAARARGILALIQFRQAVKGEVLSELDGVYQQAAQNALDQSYEAALQGFLAIVQRDRIYRQDGARRAMLGIFDLLGNEDPLTKSFRKQLMMALY
jgi:putative thioredoxin